MAHRLLPFRQYDENDVINLYAMDLTAGPNLLLTKPGVDGKNADGVFVSVSQGAIGDDVIDVGENADLQNSYASPVGRNPYPTNPLKISAAASGDAVIGVTLKQTLSIDENNENLQFNPVKKDELQAVLSGQTVPVLSKGIVTLHENAFDTDVSNGHAVPGAYLKVNSAGKVDGVVRRVDLVDGDIIGTVLASGERESKTGTDALAGSYFVCKIDC
jgi:hypothetical protein